MRAVHVDPQKRTAHVEGGALLVDLDREAHAHGLAVPSGVFPKTGIAGLTLGGGVGWLIRKYGMTIDNLLSCQVVTANGELIMASSSENPDLFWALRGGGGNFGVVTSFTFQCHPVRNVIGGLILYPRSDARDVLRNMRDYLPDAPGELTAYGVLLHTPDGTPASAVALCYCGSAADSVTALQPLRSFGSPIVDLIQEVPFPTHQSLFDGAFPDGNQNYWKSSLHAELSDGAIDAVVEQGNRMKSPFSAIVVEYYGGAAARVPNDATAFPYRDRPWDIIIAAQWSDPAESAVHRDWARETEAVLRPFGAGGHILAGLDADDAAESAFGANLPRLREIKRRYDPENFFRVNQNIRPA